MFDIAAMSPAEIQFIRLYIKTLKREYYFLRTVLDLMHPDNLGVEKFLIAANMSLKLAEMQQDFDSRIRQIQRKNNIRTLYVPPAPSLDELADMFSRSFFKLVTTTQSKKTGSHAYTNGWFSGKPTDWKSTVSHCKSVPKSDVSFLPSILGDIFNAALKLFKFEDDNLSFNQSNIVKKIWPPESNAAYWDDETSDDENDNESDPFGWLFDDIEDDD